MLEVQNSLRIALGHGRGWAGLGAEGRFRAPTASDVVGVSGVSRLVLSIVRVVVTKSLRLLGYTQRLRELHSRSFDLCQVMVP